MSSNHTIPSRKAIKDTLVNIACSPKYKTWKSLEGCKIEYTNAVEGVGNSSMHAYRITTDVGCDVSTFRAFITTLKNSFLYDGSLEAVSPFFVDELTGVTCLHSKYKAVSVVSARDFCSWQCHDTAAWGDLNSREQQLVAQLRGVKVNGNTADKQPAHNPSEAFIYASINSERVPQVPGWVRGTIHTFGYVAFPLENGSGIRLTNVLCVDPKGNIPQFALDGANADNAKKLHKIKEMCELLGNIVANMKIHLPVPEGDLMGKANIKGEGAASKPTSPSAGPSHADPNNEFVLIDEDEMMTAAPKPSTVNADAATRATADPKALAAAAMSRASIATDGTLELVDVALDHDDEDRNNDNDGIAAENNKEYRNGYRAPTPGTAGNSKSPTPAPESLTPPAAPPATNDADEGVVAAAAAASEPTPIPDSLLLDDDRRPHFERIMGLHIKSADAWNATKTLDNCLLEDLKVDFSHIKATRISTDVKCSVESFAQYMGNLDNQKHYDPKIEVFEVLQRDTPRVKGVVTYSAYKRETRWISPRDFCCHSASFLLTDPELIKGYGFSSDIKKVYVSNTVSITSSAEDAGLPNKPLDKNWVRGNIHVFGYVVTATSLTADRCKVYSIACVDPAGSLPGAVMDAMNVENCKKVALVRKLCEEAHAKEPASLIGVRPEDLLGPSSSSAAKKKAAPETLVAPSSHNNNAGDDDSDADSDASFESCLDEDEVKREVEDLKAFYASETNAICRRLTALHGFKGWALVGTKGAAKVESVLTPLCGKKAVKVSLEAECTLEDFWSVISNVQYTRRYDAAVDKLEVLQSPPYGSVLYTSYKGVGGIIEPRDFCTITASKFLSEREGSDAQLYTEGIHSSALVVNSVDCDDYPQQEGIVRGSVFAHGYIAIATPPTARRIRICHIALVDPKGSLDMPAKMEDMAAMGLADKAIAVAQLAEAYGRGELKKAAPLDNYQRMEDVDEDLYLCQMLRNHAQLRWGTAVTLGSVAVDTSLLPPSDATKNRKLIVVRATTEIKCSLATFEAAINNADNRRKYEPEIEVLQFHDGPANATLSTCCYKRERHLSMGSCAVNEVTVGRALHADEMAEFQLVTSGMNAAVYAVNTADWGTEVPMGLVEEGFAPSKALVNGYVAVAIPPEAPRVRVTHQWCVYADGEGGGEDSTKARRMQQEAANRLVRLAALCESTEAVKAQAFAVNEEVLANASFSSARSRGISVMSNNSITNNSPLRSGNSTDELQNSGASPMTKPRGMSVSPNAAPSPADLRAHRLYSKLLGLVDREDWKKGAVVEGCLIETCAVDYTSFNAVRISTHFNCSLETLRDFLGEEANVRKYDATLETFELLKKNAESAILYINYKRQSRLVSARDFVTENANQLLSREDAIALKLTNLTDNHGAYLQTCVSVNGYKAPTKDWVRGTIHAFGYLAIAEGPKRCQVFNYACVDPSGSIPKWVSDATTSLSAKTLGTIRMFCEEKEKRKE